MRLRLNTHARIAVAAAAGAALLLGGCSSSGGDADSSASPACTRQADGPQAKAVTVSGEFGQELSVTFDKPMEAKELQVHVVTEGDGPTTKNGDALNTMLSLFSGKTGKLAASEDSDLVVGSNSLYPSFNAAINCVPVGSRVVTVIPADQLFGESGNPGLGIEGNETVILVADLKKITPPPTVSDWTERVPSVTFDKDGVPTVKLPGTEAPEGLKVKVLKQGDGATVQAGDDVTIDYQGLKWKDGEVFDQSYGSQPATFNTSGVIPGFSAAMVGQKVGTQLLVTIPSEYAYREGSQSELAGEDLVFLIEIKSTSAPSPAPSESAS